MLSYEKVIKIADEKYKELKSEKNPFTAPELLPEGIVSDQIRAIAFALVNETNKQIELLLKSR